MPPKKKVMDVLAVLREIDDDANILDEMRDDIENMLRDIIQIEKRHLYGLDKTSQTKRREEIFTYLNKKFEEGN